MTNRADLRERLVPVVATAMVACEYAEGDVGREVRDLIRNMLSEVADWLDERATGLSDGNWHEEATLLAEERIGTYREIARLLRGDQ